MALAKSCAFVGHPYWSPTILNKFSLFAFSKIVLTKFLPNDE